ncbi:MAG: hypothetical protein KBF83_02265 [Pyrinomonadaceae bacterium]|nr:hypothetical protein [Pyrinomonadaceae bacterium]
MKTTTDTRKWGQTDTFRTARSLILAGVALMLAIGISSLALGTRAEGDEPTVCTNFTPIVGITQDQSNLPYQATNTVRVQVTVPQCGSAVNPDPPTSGTLSVSLPPYLPVVSATPFPGIGGTITASGQTVTYNHGRMADLSGPGGVRIGQVLFTIVVDIQPFYGPNGPATPPIGSVGVNSTYNYANGKSGSTAGSKALPLWYSKMHATTTRTEPAWIGDEIPYTLLTSGYPYLQMVSSVVNITAPAHTQFVAGSHPGTVSGNVLTVNLGTLSSSSAVNFRLRVLPTLTPTTRDFKPSYQHRMTIVDPLDTFATQHVLNGQLITNSFVYARPTLEMQWLTPRTAIALNGEFSAMARVTNLSTTLTMTGVQLNGTPTYTGEGLAALVTPTPAPVSLAPGQTADIEYRFRGTRTGKFKITGEARGTASGTYISIPATSPELCVGCEEVELSIDLDKFDYNIGEEFLATVEVKSNLEQPVTVTFNDPLLRERPFSGVAADAILTVEPPPLPAPFQLTATNRTRSFPAVVRVNGYGETELVTALSYTGPSGPVTLEASQRVDVSPLAVTLEMRPLRDGVPIKNLLLDGNGNATDTDGNPVIPKVLVKLENKSTTPVTAALRFVNPLGRDRTGVAGRVSVAGAFPIELGDLAGGQAVEREFVVDVDANGRYEFEAGTRAQRAGSPRLILQTEKGAPLVVGPEVKTTLRRPDENGLTATSIAEGVNSIDAPLEFKTNLAILGTQPAVEKGLVADGVTPLLIEFEVPANSIPGGTPVEYQVELEIEGGGTIAGIPAANRLNLGRSGTWVPGTGRLSFTTTENKQYAHIAPIASDNVKFSGATKEIKLRAVVTKPSNGVVVGEALFAVRKPPIALIHGYNTDGTWGDLFQVVLASSRPREDFVYTIRYGQTPVDAAVTQKLNTVLPFGSLVPIVAEELERMKTEIKTDWAMTRHDVVAHSQGGILTRLLGSKNGNTMMSEPFRNAGNFNRGRFHRAVTIGSPHNGTRIVRYMVDLQERFGAQTSGTRLGVPGAVASLLISDGTAQLKFDPAGPQIAHINQLQSGAPWEPDPGLKIHLVQTTVNNGQSPSVNSFSAADGGLGLNVTGPLVLPRGSDGVVDFDSMTATTPEAGQSPPTNSYRMPAPLQISHALVGLAAGIDLFGGTAGQVGSPDVALHVIGALDQSDSISAADRVFGPFRLPAPLPQTAIDDIQIAANAVTPGVAESIELLTGPRPATELGPSTVLRTFTFRLPVGETIASPVVWHVERFGLNGVTEQGATLEPLAGNPAAVTVNVDESVLGDVVLYGTARTNSGKVIIGSPVLVHSTEPNAANYSLSSIDISPRGGSYPIGGGTEPYLFAIYSDTQVPSNPPLRLRRWINPLDIGISSSNAGVVNVADKLSWKFAGLGTSSVEVSWRGRTIVLSFDVFDPNGNGTPTPTPTPSSTPTSTPTATPTATPAGFEADVAPRPNGDGMMLSTDITQLRRFVAGLDTPNGATNEFQRIDCAPRSTTGDGVINSSDVVQGRRYAAGLDPMTNGGGPTVPASRPTIADAIER